MKTNRIVSYSLLVLLVVLFTSCNNKEAKTTLEIESSENSVTSKASIYEKLIYVSDNIDTLNLDVSFQMKGKTGTLEILDNETEQSIWNDTWNSDVDKVEFTISLENLEKEKNYIIRFTGIEVSYVKIIMTSESSLIKEREKPIKPSRE